MNSSHRDNGHSVISTKDKIARAALELFSQKGYKAVSIRDICRVVGIRESSIYYHFKNKQAIMDVLIGQVDLIADGMRRRFDNEFAQVGQVTAEAMGEVAVGILDHYLLHPDVYRIIAVLSIERMGDETADTCYRQLLFDLPFLQQEKVFRQMIARGYIREADTRVLAREYQAVIYYAFQKNCIGKYFKENQEEQIEITRREIRENIIYLYGNMSKK